MPRSVHFVPDYEADSSFSTAAMWPNKKKTKSAKGAEKIFLWMIRDVLRATKVSPEKQKAAMRAVKAALQSAPHYHNNDSDSASDSD